MHKYLIYISPPPPAQCSGGALQTDIISDLPEGVSMKIRKPSLWGIVRRKNSLRDVVWKWISFGRCEIYSLVNTKGKLLHKSMVIGKNFKFPFLKPNEYEIGPCCTQENYRGRGFYPFVLKHIVEKNPHRSFLMLVAENNKSSIRGIEKVGFKNIGFALRSRGGRWIRI